MQVDEPFAEYVAARWSTIYRLASLLVGEDRADDLAQDALVQAYVTWPHRPADEPPEAQVKETMARRALALGPETSRAGDPRDPAPTFAALPPHQRVVVVLRWFEYLSDTDIARVLGGGHQRVETEAVAALGSVGLSPDELTTVLAGHADRAVVPLPPVEALLARGRDARRTRRRRALRRTGAAAAILGLALAGGSYLEAHPLRHEPAPLPFPRHLADLPTGAQPRTAYAELNTLHLGGGRSVVLEADPTGLVGVGRWTYASFSSGTIVRVDNDDLVISPVTETAAGPVLADRLGRYVAWVDLGQGLRRVVVQPTDPHLTSSRRREGSFPTGTGPLELAGVTPSGDVVAAAPAENKAWVWHAPGNDPSPADPVHEIEGLGNGAVYQVTPGELVVRYPPDHFAVGRLEDYAFLAEEDLVATTADFADPRGRRIVYADAAGEIHIGRRAPGSARDRSHDLRLRLPRLPSGTSGIAWEDDTHVLLEVADGSMPLGALVRCDVASGGCEVAVRFGHAPHRLAR